MRNKGFTLVELLAVMIILAIILALVFPTVNSIINNGKETVHNAQINKILNAAYDYSLDKIHLLPSYNETSYIILNELKAEGYIDSDIIDTETNEQIPNDLVISIKNVGNNYNGKKSKTSSIRGDYLYTLEFDFMKTTDFKNNKPQIIITIDDPKYTEGSLFYEVDVGDKFVDPNYSATSSNDVDITNKVVKNIIYQSKIVASIDLHTAGIYHINYCAVDLNGYSTCAVLNVVINDNSAPTLTIPGNTTISTSITSFNLKDGASCTDNSGKCNIKINGSIDFGRSGTYIIEYNASDPSGNTSSKKRVITVE